MLLSSVIFPNLGITIEKLVKSFSVFGLSIAWYGVIIAAAMVFAVILSMYLAKRTNQDVDDYIDIAIWSIICGLIGARAYYVIFSWDEYKDNLIQIFNIRAGGLAIYGGLIGGVIAAVVVCKVKKISFLRVFDTAAPTIAFAQAIGRWGNFFNMEAYGGYTDGLFAMQLNYDEASGVITDELLENLITIDEIEYIQVHPTFLYECMWCLVVGILILIFRKYQKYNGELLLWYIGGYALGRSWIEGLRTDQLLIGNSGIAVSQILSIAIVAGALALLILNRIRLITKQWTPDFVRVLAPGAPGTIEYTENRTKTRKAKRAAKKGKDAAAEAGDSEETEEAGGEETEEAGGAEAPEDEAGGAYEAAEGEAYEEAGGAEALESEAEGAYEAAEGEAYEEAGGAEASESEAEGAYETLEGEANEEAGGAEASDVEAGEAYEAAEVEAGEEAGTADASEAAGDTVISGEEAQEAEAPDAEADKTAGEA